MISLRLQGVYGMFVPASVTVTSGNAGSFQLSNTGLVAIRGWAGDGQHVQPSYFQNLNGLTELQTTTTAIPLVTRGLVLKDSVSGDPVMYAGFVAEPRRNS